MSWLAQFWPPRGRFVGTEGEDNGAAAGPRRSARLAQRQQAAPADGDGRRRSRRLAARAGGDGADGADGAGAEGDAANTSDADMGIDWESDEESYVEDEDAEFDDDDEEVDYVDDDEDEDFDDVTSDSGIVGGYAAVPTSDVGPLSDDARRMAEGLYSGVMLDKVRAAEHCRLRYRRQAFCVLTLPWMHSGRAWNSCDRQSRRRSGCCARFGRRMMAAAGWRTKAARTN